jgi:ABC-type nitrate/sulfonate/bicarbonate transport system substrate-binding protein
VDGIVFVVEAPRTLTIESISAFNGLDVLVARDAGLFAAEGLDVEIARPRSGQRLAVDQPIGARACSRQ